jgi:hypothetical protein
MSQSKWRLFTAAGLALTLAGAGVPMTASAQSSQSGQASTMAPKATKKKSEQAQKPTAQQVSRAELDAKEREQTKALNEAQLKK